jgi:FAD/FMN-containing dehydrogenase
VGIRPEIGHDHRTDKFACTIVGADYVLTGEAAAPHCTDWRGRYSGNALAVLFPSSTQQVAEVVKLCAANQIAIVPQGGNTGLCGASVPYTAWGNSSATPYANTKTRWSWS